MNIETKVESSAPRELFVRRVGCIPPRGGCPSGSCTFPWLSPLFWTVGKPHDMSTLSHRHDLEASEIGAIVGIDVDGDAATRGADGEPDPWQLLL
ncbi:hypothetical protein [Microbispora triticiradicis]|uniref:hypothetical protein n=1 Tax=Microbispora triticiradicis TaxID=2200763 RepID=UPI001AD64C3B|nr:hypothetical protein [Microbispora triticiradicis]MBO4273162.1 hypothetical protein [Microbispora triticiradicis]